MIQRIQTIFLVLGVVFTAAFFFIPFGYAPVIDTATGVGVLQPLKGLDFMGLIVPAAVSMLLMVGSIFTYKNYSLQKKLALFAGLALVATIGVVIYAVISPYIDSNPEVTIATVWGGGGLFLVGALIADIAAYCYISKDQRLIRSYDRIR